MHWKPTIHSLRRSFATKLSILAASVAALSVPSLQAQITNILFSEDFESGTIDSQKLVPDAPFFEGGQGDFQAYVNAGVLEFAGTVTQQYWAGTTMRIVPTFEVSDAEQVAIEVDRVFEGGVGTASRSALWIMDASQTRYVLFADVRGELGWRYNRKIGVAGDVPTGGGTEMLDFNDSEEGGLHVMKAVADGRNVRLYLDDRLGATIPFPFTNLVFHVGSYARANSDTAFTQFDNLKVYSIGAATFEPTTFTAVGGQTVSNIVVRIPEGLNATEAVELRVVSSNPAVGVPSGATGDTLTLTFAAGATNAQTINISAIATGGTTLTLANDIGLTSGNSFDLTVISNPGIQLQDDFAGATLDPAKWERNDAGFETGLGVFQVLQENGLLTLAGFADAQYWGGVSVRSIPIFTATEELPLVVEVDRVAINRTKFDETISSAARSSLWLTTTNRGQYIMFAQNFGENGWQVNVNNTGGGTDIAAFNALDGSTNLHRMKLVADGEGVDVYLDDIFGGRFAFPVRSGLHVELGAYTRAIADEVVAAFDNLKVENVLPCITIDTTYLSPALGQNENTVTVTVPRFLNATAAASVTITSQNPSVAIPQGAVNGSLTLNFPVGSASEQTFTVQTVGVGSATFQVTSEGVCVDDSLVIEVTAVPNTLLADDFSATTLSNKWIVEAAAIVDGAAASPTSGVIISNGMAAINVTADIASWPGFTVLTEDSFRASLTEPAAFEIDRTEIAFNLVTGTSAKQLTGIWITNSVTGEALFFSELVTHDGTAGGWQYHLVNSTNPIPATAVGTAIEAFGDARFNDRGEHRLRAVANGQTVKLYLDGILGAQVPFPVAQDIRFGFGTYVMAATDVATGAFDNAVVLGTESTGPEPASLTATRAENGDITITWTQGGTLESSNDLGGDNWTAVTPAPTGNTYTVTAASQEAHRFYRVVSAE